jgi:lipopolysaccharide/colanic/teichoic acid biosynthesis glycosyltransferase
MSTAYIFVIPARLVKRGEVRALMFRVVKRTIDIIGALVGMILTLPFWIILPILMRLDSPGSVFYTQVRVGVNRRVRDRRYYHRAHSGEHRIGDRRREDHLGRPFRVIKFRTMIRNAEKVSGPVWATKNDPRITRLGAILRKTRLDEVPQFLNILKGDMSLVGPRPERPVFVRDLSGKVDNYAHRLQVKPGLTGLAQVENGYDSSLTSVVDKVRFDLQYIRDWSLFADIKIILKTFLVVVTGRGAC